MKKQNLAIFNKVYSNTKMYYGWELRKEFTEFIGNVNLVGKTVLDIGCGEGRYSLFLSERGCNVTAIDASLVALKKLAFIGNGRNQQINIIISVLENYAFQKNAFDIVIATTILDHLGDNLRQRIVRGIKETLNVGGIVYTNVFTIFDPGYEVIVKKSANYDNQNVSDTALCIEHYFEPNELYNQFVDLEILYYYEGIEADLSHGKHHNHGWASLIARKKATQQNM